MNYESPLGRIEAMRLILLWEGEIGRARVVSLFGVGETRASQWIREFRENCPGIAEWNPKTKSFHALPATFQSAEQEFGRPEHRYASLTRYLALTGLPLDDAAARIDGMRWASYPELSAPRPSIFSALQKAVRYGSVLQIKYCSMNNPEPHVRDIAPHGLVKAGRRWHTRAYCENAQEFRDFAIGRIAEINPIERRRTREPADDTAWNTWVEVKLVAHPGLTKAQARVIQYEYFVGATSRTERVRASLVHYFLLDMMASIDVTRQKAPEYQLAIANLDEVRIWLFP